MRKVVASVLVLGLMSFGAPVGLLAQAAQQASISGEALDAGGRPLANIRVDLLEAAAGQPVGGVLQTTTTTSEGAWTFTSVEPGDSAFDRRGIRPGRRGSSVANAPM